jgi:hypothetical protein
MFNPVDVYDDVNHQQLYALDKLVGVPDFVKSAELDATKPLPSSAFADPIRRKFPCHTKSATWLANAYFQQVASLYPKDQKSLVQDRIIKCADYWKIRGMVDDFNKKWEKMSRFDSPDVSDSDYAIVANVDGHRVRRLPMPTPMATKIAGERLFADRFSYTYPMRKMAARRILLKAAQIDKVGVENAVVGGLAFEPETEEYLTKAAGIGTTHPQWAAERIANRVLMMGKFDPTNEVQMNMAKVADIVSKMDAPDTETYHKLAELIDEVDRATGICNHYIHGVELPEEIFFDVQEKTASAIMAQHVVLQNGNVYRIGEFASLPLEKISEVLGAEFAEAVQDEYGKIDPEKFAEIAPTLPRDDANLLERVIQKAGPGDADLSKEATQNRNIDWSTDALKSWFQEKGARVQTRSPISVKMPHGQNVELASKESEEKVKGGLADGAPDSTFPKSQLRKGMKVEKEHTDSPQVAKEITKDHLEENKQYYTHLDKMEKEMDKESAPSRMARAGKSISNLTNKMPGVDRAGTQLSHLVGGHENLGALGVGAAGGIGAYLIGRALGIIPGPKQRGSSGPVVRQSETPAGARDQFGYE